MKNKDINLLGLKVCDLVTGFEGIVTSISFDLYGCVQALITPEFNEKREKPFDSRWFDSKRIKILNKKPVMDVPKFVNIPGGQELPLKE